MTDFLFHPSRFWHCLIIFILVYGIIAALFYGISIGVGLADMPYPYSFILPFGVAMLCGLFIYYKMNGSKSRKTMFVGDVNWQVSCIYIILFVVFMYSFMLLTPPQQSTHNAEVDNIYLQHFAIFIFSWFTAIGEEVMFRGIFFNALKKRYNPWLIIIVISLLFGLGHPEYFLHVVSAFLSSVFFFIAYYRTKSLLLTILMHFSGDFFMPVLLNLQHGAYYSITGGIILLSISFIGFFLLDLHVRKNAISVKSI